MNKATDALRIFVSLVLLAPAGLGGVQDDKNKQAQKGAPDAAAGELSEGRRLLRGGDAAGALVRLQSALRLFTQDGRRPGVASANELIGELYERQGLHDLSAHYYGRSLKAVEEGLAEKKKKADGYNYNLLLARYGHAQLMRGDVKEARKAYGAMFEHKIDKGALGQLKRKGPLAGIAGVLGGSDDKGLQINVGALLGYMTAKSEYDFYRLANIYAERELGLGRLDFREKNYADARKHFENVLDATDESLPFLGKLGRTRRHRAVAHTSLGDTALAEGKLEDAVKNYQQAERDATKAERLDLAWPAQRGLGRARRLLVERAKNPQQMRKLEDASLASYRAAVASVETLRLGSVRADEARAAFLTTTRAVYEEASASLADLALAYSAPGQPLEGGALAYAEEAFRFAELGRARSLLDLLSETGARVEGGIAPEDLDARRRNLERQQEVAHLLTGLRLAGEDGEEKDEDVEKLGKEADELHAQYVEIENRIRSRHPRYRELTAAEPLTLEAVRRQLLDAGTALLEYSLGAERSYLFAVTDAGVTLHALPSRDDLGRQVENLRAQILPPALRRRVVVLTDEEAYRGLRVAPAQTDTDAAAFARASHELYKTVVAPAAAFVGERRLLVVPEGALSYTPFEALVTAEGGTDYAALPYLLRRNEVVYAPSASVVAALRRQAAAAGPADSGALLVVADPVFDAGDPRARQPAEAARAAVPDSILTGATLDVTKARLGGEARFARLAGTRAEAEQIERLAASAGLKVDKWLDLDASEANASTRDLRPYRVLHFATHGLLNAERPQFTGLVLSLVGNGGGADGFLRTDEVFNLKLGSPLVMLSACETGLGKERRGEGVIGLTRAFMYAGAPVVGVSLWSVADQSTAQLMSDFYKNLLGGAGGPSAAMRAARRSLIDGKRYSAPFHWAPFVMVGDWR
jgi:CHAT domain-containing protein/tetratricopeptide (TPR) repeat protein